MKKSIKLMLVCMLGLFLLCGCASETMSVLSNSESEVNSLESSNSQEDNQNSASVASEDDNLTGTEQSQSAQDNAEEGTVIYVFVCGAVQNEGVYELPVDARAEAALEAAGGFSENANTSAVNLAGTLVDGEQLYFPEIGEEVDIESLNSENKSGNISGQDDRINLNTATKEQLTTLSGIGDVKADNIIAYRDKTGSFQNAEDIMNVDGIGQAIYDKIKEKIYVD
jgi:competence protein ComEA